jgi:large subunit ribosomal protein L24
MRVRKGDTVEVLQGKDRGVRGEVMAVDPVRNRVIVDGVNIAKKHQRPTQAARQGGIIDKAMPIDASNVAVVCPKTGKPGKVGYRYEGDTKVRFHKASGEELS